MTIRFIDGFDRFSQVMGVAQPVWNVWRHYLNSDLDGVLFIQIDSTDGDINHVLHLAKEANRYCQLDTVAEPCARRAS